MKKNPDTTRRLPWLRGDAPYLLILASIAVLAHRPWFDPRTAIFAGDWQHWSDEAVRQVHYGWLTWIHYGNFGGVDPQIPFYGFMAVWSGLANIGLNFDNAAKLTFFVPASCLALLSPYVLARKLVGDRFIAFVVALFYASTTYGVVNQPPFLMVYALAPLLLYLLIRALEERTVASGLILSLAYTVSIVYEVRITFVVTIILAIYALLMARQPRRLMRPLLFFVLAAAGLNAFWVLPTFLTDVISTVNDLTDNGLFGSFLFDLPHAFTISTWVWTGGRIGTDFTKHPVVWYLWIFPLTAFLSLLVAKTERRRTAVFAVIALLGVFLSKQAAEPFSGVYSWSFNHLPGFRLFREASKFYTITAIGYAGLIGFTLLALKQASAARHRKIVFPALAAVLICASLWTLKPMFTLELGSLMQPKEMPHDLQLLNEFVGGQTGPFRTLWLPYTITWFNYSMDHPKVSAAGMLGGRWGEFIGPYSGNPDLAVDRRLLELIESPSFRGLLDSGSIAYIVVSSRDLENYRSFVSADGERQAIEALDALDWLERTDIGAEHLAVYRNPGHRPLIYVSGDRQVVAAGQPAIPVEYVLQDTTRYALRLRGLGETSYLHFAEEGHPGWRLRAGRFSWPSVLFAKDYFLPDAVRYEDDAGFNSYVLEKGTVCAAGGCRMNPDGSYDVDLTLFFRPQVYMTFGGVISISTLALCAGYLLHAYCRRKRRVGPARSPAPEI